MCGVEWESVALVLCTPESLNVHIRKLGVLLLFLFFSGTHFLPCYTSSSVLGASNYQICALLQGIRVGLMLVVAVTYASAGSS